MKPNPTKEKNRGLTVVFRNERGTAEFTVFCEKQEPGYYLGGMRLLLGDHPSIGIHVELIEVTKKAEAKSSVLQVRIDNWHKNNEGHSPRLLWLGNRWFFANLEVYAA